MGILHRAAALARPGWDDRLVLACLAFAIATGSRMLSLDGDAARHLTIGDYILSTGHINLENFFSYTLPGASMAPYEWLARVISATTDHLAGLGGVVLIHGLAFGLAFAVVLRQIVARGDGARIARWVTVLALSAAAVHWLARPHVFTLLGTALFASMLDAWHSGRAASYRLWLLPLMMIPWVNLNGGFIVGLLLLATYVGADLVRLAFSANWETHNAVSRLRTAIPVAMTTLLATLVTPVGPGLLIHAQTALSDRLVMDRTSEFQSPNFHQMAYLPFLLMLLGVILSIMWSQRRPFLQEGLQLVGFTLMALVSARNIPLFAIVIAPLLASQIGALPLPKGGFFRRRQASSHRLAGEEAKSPDRGTDTGWHLAPVAVAMGLLVVAGIQARAGDATLGVQFDPSLQPVGAVGYLKEHQPLGNGFNKLEWGGYLLHELWPMDRVFIDGQTDFYGDALVRDYLQVAELHQDWQDVLDRYRIGWVVYSSDSPLVRALKITAGWRVAYEDSTAAVMVR